MTQAATLDTQQLQRVLDYLKTRRHYQRNRVMLLLTHWSMLRVGEVAALRYCDVMDGDGGILAETVLAATQTKGDRSRRIWFNERMRAELAAYVSAHKPNHKTQRLFYTQRSEGFTANTLTHIINSCNDPPVFAQVRLLISMIDRFVPVFSCPRLDEAGVGYKTQSSH